MHLKSILTSLYITFAVLSTTGTEPLWRATRQTVYEPSERDEATLVKSYEVEITYDAQGRIIEELQTPVSGAKMRSISTYYETSGKLHTEEVYILSGAEWVLSSTKLREYDELSGIITLSEDYTYADGEKRPGNCFRRTINRNADGNVAGVELAVLFNGYYDPTRRLSMVYGDDGKITAIGELMLTASSAGDLVWIAGQRFTDITWESFDGQIASITDLYYGNNRIASGHYVNDNGTKPYDNYDITATYSGENFTAVHSGMCQGIENTEITIIRTVEPADHGGVTYSTRTSYADKNGQHPTENYLDINTFDAWNIEVESSEYYWENDDEANKTLEFRDYAEVTYDATYGYPLEQTDYSDDAPIGRIIYSGYIDCLNQNSIIEHKTDITDNGVYHDLSGRRINGPCRGIYIHNGKKIINQ